MNQKDLEYTVRFAKHQYKKDGRILCRKCVCLIDPISTNDYKTLRGISKEQYISGICSDSCWDACSEREITKFKFLFPLYLHEDCVKTRVNFV
jgi:hypothetical protein